MRQRGLFPAAFWCIYSQLMIITWLAPNTVYTVYFIWSETVWYSWMINLCILYIMSYYMMLCEVYLTKSQRNLWFLWPEFQVIIFWSLMMQDSEAFQVPFMYLLCNVHLMELYRMQMIWHPPLWLGRSICSHALWLMTSLLDLVQQTEAILLTELEQLIICSRITDTSSPGATAETSLHKKYNRTMCNHLFTTPVNCL